MSPFPPPDPVAERLNALFGGEFDAKGPMGLDALRDALARLGDPQLRQPPVVHVAGTNGKGSIVAFLRAMAQSAGLRPHIFTQPHLIRTAERIALAGQNIDESAFLAAIEQVAAVAPNLTHFEAQTAAALVLFAAHPADLAILEVGCGGRHDATNVIPAPHVCAIAPIDLDHVALLGPTLANIAAHKAGIIKPGATVICARQARQAEGVILEHAERAGCPALLEGRDWQAWRERESLIVQTDDALLELPLPALSGAHQIANAGLAVLAAKHMGLSAPAIASALPETTHPGRLQRLRVGAIAKVAPDCAVFVDGGHNAHAARALAEWAAALPGRRLALVVGMLADKDAARFLAPFAGLAVAVVAVAPHGPRPAMPAARLASGAQDLGLTATAAPDLLAATHTAAGRAGPGGVVLITGSLALAGEALFLSELS